MFTNNDEPSGTPSTGGGDVAGAIINAGAGLLQGHYDRKTSRENTDKTIAANKSEAELAYQRQVEMWNMQNLYNSPQAQMERFKAGGLNPHLIYGQGSAGNASNIPTYQPARMQYNYAAPNYGSAIQTVLPTLMSVGTWMQQMKLSQAEYDQKRTNTERARQMVEYLTSANPKLLTQLDNRLSLFPYQRETQRYGVSKAALAVSDLDAEYRLKYGDGLWSELRHDVHTPYQSEIGGMSRLRFLEQAAKSKIAGAKASWTDFNITDPQAIIQLVMSGVLGMAGQQLRMSKGRINQRRRVTHETESRMKGGRVNFRRRIYD